MSEYEFDLMVYIGRLQPLHTGHMNMIRLGLKSARRLIILVGSHNSPLTARNPWTSEERQDMLRASLWPEEYNRCLVAGLEDFTYNDAKWEKRVKEIVQGFNAIYGGGSGSEERIGITGFDRDSTSYYLGKFPEWKTSLKPEIEKIGATEIRTAYFDHGTILTDVLPEAVSSFLVQFKKTGRYQYLKDEHAYCKECRKVTQGDAKFPVIIHTVDNVVLGPGPQILLIKRGNQPGLGLWAMPGGHLEVDETLVNAAKRELLEETGIDLRGNIVPTAQHTFDDPNRSNRGRCITTAFRWPEVTRVESPSGTRNLPTTMACDDAVETKWFTLHELQRIRSQIHEDHYHIIDYFLDLKLVT